MKYELEQLETLIQTTINKEDELFFLDIEGQRICSVFIKRADDMDIDSLKKYFKIHQLSLCKLSDNTYNQLEEYYINPPDSLNLNTAIIFLQHVIKTLNGILTFIQANMTAYFEFDTKIPDSMISDFVTAQTIHHLHIENTLINKGLHPTLITHLLDILKFKNKYPGEEITYAQYKNIINISNRLSEYLNNGDCETNNYKIHKLIISLNLRDKNVYL